MIHTYTHTYRYRYRYRYSINFKLLNPFQSPCLLVHPNCPKKNTATADRPLPLFQCQDFWSSWHTSSAPFSRLRRVVAPRMAVGPGDEEHIGLIRNRRFKHSLQPS